MMQKIIIYTKENKEAYQALLQNYHLQLDIYYDIEFLILDAAWHKGEAEIFVAIADQHIFIYPYLKLPIAIHNQIFFDLSSPYGYGGPYCNNTNFFKIGELEFLAYAQEQNFITEFVRYHYLYNNELKFSQNILNEYNRNIVVLDLQESWENIWAKNMSTTNRNIVRKLEKEGFQFEITQDTSHLEAFIKMYHDTMKNAQAQAFYFFKESFFYDLFEKLPTQLFLARTFKEDITYASALFFITPHILTYYLSARNLDYPKIHTSNLLLTKVAQYAKSQNIAQFNLGGGRSTDEKDSLYQFKKNFSDIQASFFVGKRIHNQDIYQYLQQDFIQKHTQAAFDKVKHMLQFYR